MNEHPTTYADASAIDLDELLVRLADASRWPAPMPPGVAAELGAPERTTAVDLEELASMAVVSRRLRDHLPMIVHGAVLRGATREEVVDALGIDGPAVAALWSAWADPKLDGHVRHGWATGVTSADHVAVSAVLVGGAR